MREPLLRDDCVLQWMNAEGVPALAVAVAHSSAAAVVVLWPGVSRYVMDGVVGLGAGRCVSLVDRVFGMVGLHAKEVHGHVVVALFDDSLLHWRGGRDLLLPGGRGSRWGAEKPDLAMSCGCSPVLFLGLLYSVEGCEVKGDFCLGRSIRATVGVGCVIQAWGR
eukprot:1670006-Rhodomonas_salina.2